MVGLNIFYYIEKDSWLVMNNKYSMLIPNPHVEIIFSSFD